MRPAAVLILAVILGVAILHWPLPSLGFSLDPATGYVLTVAPGSAAAQDDLRPGDQIVRIYDYPWAVATSRLLLVPLPWRDGTPTPMTIRRGDEVRDLVLYAGRPDLALQIDKALRLLVALICWGTGTLLGASPQAINQRLQRAAWFWMLLGGVLALYQLAQVASYTLTAALLWGLGTLLAPAAVMMHLWYPSRPLTPAVVERAQRWWWISLGLLQGAALVLVIVGRTVAGILGWLDSGVTLLFLGSFVLSAIILGRAYRETHIAHIRRQIRLIVGACVLVASGWAVLVLGEMLAPALIALVPPVALTAISGVIPLAYLLGGTSTDLLRVNRVARWLVIHALTIVAILAPLAGIAQLGALPLSPVMIAGVALAAYPSTYGLIRRLAAGAAGRAPPYAALSQTTAQLGSTLDSRALAAILSAGLQATFHHPSVTIYLRPDPADDQLSLVRPPSGATPQAISAALLEAIFRDAEIVLSIGAIQQRLDQQALDEQAAALVFAPYTSLWGGIRPAQGAVIGLVILGPRGDQDPYRDEDLRELERLLHAAALAFSNSASYTRQVQAQATIRQLYRRLQQAQDETEASIAREIHDEVLNVNVRLNIMALERLLAQADDPPLREAVQAILESEQDTGQMLRMICEQLRPADADDPLGLVASLRRTVAQVRGGWVGQIDISVTHAPVAIERQVHRELVLIAREAVVNAIKHAEASAIGIEIQFPAQTDDALTLIIRDNGRTQQRVAPRAGHMGLSFMHESADAIGAAMRWEPVATGGTAVIVTLPTVVGQPTTSQRALASEQE